MTPEQIKEKYEERITLLLASIADYFADSGQYKVSSITDMSSDIYRWTFTLHRGGDGSQDIDFTITICESEFWDDCENGVNFLFDIVEWGGRVIGNFAVHQYSEKCWVSRDDEIAIEKRFELFFERLGDLESIFQLVKKWIKDNPLKEN